MLLLLLLLTLPAAVQAQFTYTTYNGTIAITGYTGPGGDVIIPDMINGLPVTGIWTAAFNSLASLTTVTIPNTVTEIGDFAFAGCTNLTYVSIPSSVAVISKCAFLGCTSLPSVTIPNGVIGAAAFKSCSSLTSANIGSGVTSIISQAFMECTNLTAIAVDVSNSVYSSVDGVLFNKRQTTLVEYPGGKAASYTIPNNVTNVGPFAFAGSSGLTNVTIPYSVTSMGDYAFDHCTSLTGVYFEGNAPILDLYVFFGDDNTTVYYLPGTTGWGTTFGGRPTAVWWIPPAIQGSPQSQTAEAGSAVGLQVQASGPLLFHLWYFNYTTLISCSTNCELELTNVQFSESGAYTVVVTNVAGVVTSSPAMLNVIAAVERRPTAGVKVTGEAGSLLNLDYANSFSPAPDWTTLGSVSLISTSQYCFDLTMPLPPQRFYRAWQTGTPGVMPALDLHIVPAITLTGSTGDSVRVDYINRFGPIDAWVTLATVALTNTSQLYFDTSAPGQPERLYRLVPLP